MVTGVVWWETSQGKDVSREVALSGLGSGTDSSPSDLTRLESMEMRKETLMVGIFSLTGDRLLAGQLTIRCLA